VSSNLTILLIFVTALLAACYAISRLAGTPARIVAVIVALGMLIGALKPIAAILSEPQHSPSQVVAPAVPVTESSPTAR
jgi:hypothetical protein